jgi:signal transduction histidine kinase
VPADAEQLERARVAATSLSGLVGQLGELTQAEAATLQRRPEPFDLGALAAEVALGLEALARAKGVAIVVTGPAASVMADRGQLTRAVRNVVTNAVQHAPPGSEVSVSTAPRTLRVTDRGPGIAKADVPFVFERFYRADRSRGRQPAGSGIGLTVARELVAANGGMIEVETTGPAGTTIRIELPSA